MTMQRLVAATNAIRRLTIEFKKTKMSVILVFGVTFGIGRLVFHIYETHRSTWAFMSPSLLTKSEDFLYSCKTLRNVYRFETYIKSQPFHGQFYVHDATCENDEFNLSGAFSLTNTAGLCSTDGDYAAAGNENVAQVRFFDIRPSRLPCVPKGWDFQVWLLRKELLVPYWQSYLTDE